LTSSLQKDWPSLSCPSSTGFRFWSHEWEKHGTCAESEEIDQHGYFEAALKLKEKANLLQALNNAGACIHGLSIIHYSFPSLDQGSH